MIPLVRSSILGVKRFERFQSTLSSEIQKLSSALGSKNEIEDYQQILSKLSTYKGQTEKLDNNLIVLDDVFGKINEDDSLDLSHKEQLHNFVISNFVAYDPSLSTIHQRHLNKLGGRLSLDALAEVLRHNSGRVNSTWEVFAKYYQELRLAEVLEKDDLLRVVIDKLLKGDSADREDELFKLSELSLAKALILSKNLKNGLDSELNSELFKLALEHEVYQLIGQVPFHPAFFQHIHGLNEEQTTKLFSVLDIAQFTEEDIIQNIQVFEKLILSLSDPLISVDDVYNSESQAAVSEALFSLREQLTDLDIQPLVYNNIPTKDALFDQLLQKIQPLLKSEDNRFDSLRRAVLKAEGINRAANGLKPETFTDLLKQSVDSEVLQANMGVVSAYHYVLTRDPNLLDKIFESVKIQPHLNNIRALILAGAFHDLEKSLNLYNKHIKIASRSNNEGGISEAGLLTESLLLAYLSQQDREFAYLIHDGAVMNNIVEGDVALGRLKACFKRYGEIVGEDEENIKPLLKLEVLKAIKDLI